VCGKQCIQIRNIKVRARWKEKACESVCVWGAGVGGVGVACHVSPPLFLARGQMKCNNRRQFATKRIQTNRRS